MRQRGDDDDKHFGSGSDGVFRLLKNHHHVGQLGMSCWYGACCGWWLHKSMLLIRIRQAQAVGPVCLAVRAGCLPGLHFQMSSVLACLITLNISMSDLLTTHLYSYGTATLSAAGSINSPRSRLSRIPHTQSCLVETKSKLVRGRARWSSDMSSGQKKAGLLQQKGSKESPCVGQELRAFGVGRLSPSAHTTS
jgi:hypothetical protein